MHTGYTTNEYGTEISGHMCETCGKPFTICPAQPPEDNHLAGRDCLTPECTSYDAGRDFGLMLEGNVRPIGGMFSEDAEGNVARVLPGKGVR